LRHDRSFCGAVDGFDEGDAAAAFEAVAGGGAVVLDGSEKIFEDGLVAAEIADDGGGGALVFVGGCGFGGGGWSVSEIGGDDAVVLENDCAFGAGDFDAAWVAGIGGGGGVEKCPRRRWRIRGWRRRCLRLRSCEAAWQCGAWT